MAQVLDRLWIAGEQVLDTFKGDILYAGVVPISGTIEKIYINKAPEGTELPIPASVVADGATFELGVIARNTSTVNITGGVEVKVWDPDGVLRAAPSIDWAGMTPDEALRWEYGITSVDKVGTWIAEITFWGEAR